MFRMEFHSGDAVEEDEDRSRSYGSDGHNGTVSPKIYKGRVGKLGKMQRVVSSNEAVESHLSPITITRTRSLHSENSIPENWVEVDLIDFSTPKPETQTREHTSAGEQEVIRELVKPFAESVNLTHGHAPTVIPPRDLLSDGVEAAAPVGPSPNTASLQMRTDSMCSTNSSTRSESSDTESSTGHFKEEPEKGSPATRSVNKAFNKLMHLKKNKPTVPEAKFVKPWDEPLLLIHEQAKLERKAQKEAKREAEIQQRELLELANPVPESSLRHQKEHGVRKGIHKLFHIHGGIHSNQLSPREGVCHGDSRESKLVMPRAGMFEAPVMSPSSTDISLSQIRSGPRPVAKTDLTFATVESNQRDVRPWTTEEYMAKNARLGEWERRRDDEEFGGIEGNQLLNQYFNNDVFDNLDSSDSD